MNAILDVNFLPRTPPPDLDRHPRDATPHALSRSRFLRLQTSVDKKAVVAVAHAMLVAAYHLLARHTTYQEPGADYYERRHAERVRQRAVQLLERQGYRVTLEPAA